MSRPDTRSFPMPGAATPSRALELPSLDEIRSQTLEKFGKRPCLWQMHICEAVLRGDRDVISIAGTGMGKTLTFWMPLLFRPHGIQLIVTPLNILGQQNIQTLEQANIEAIFISAKTATECNFHDIASFRYRVVVVNPEELMRPGGGFEKLMQDKLFNDRLISIVIDEAHCISEWGSFRSEYRQIGRLRYIQRKLCPMLVTSATLSPTVIKDVKQTLKLREENLVFSQCSIDRPNIRLAVRQINNPLKSFLDLKFLLCDWKIGNPPPPKFLVFFDDINESVQAALTLRKLLPKEQQCHVKWFNSEMSDAFKEAEAARLASGETWGLMTTDSFGMGMDIPDIMVVVQWRATKPSISTPWQRFGRCARDPMRQGTAILLAEKEYFDAEREKKREAGPKRKRPIVKREPGSPAVKRSRTKHSATQTINPDSSNIDGDMTDEEDSTVPVPKKKGKTKQPKMIDDAVDNLINIQTRNVVERCRRHPLVAPFENSRAISLHLNCNSTEPDGCSRCCPTRPAICCDLHNPDDFAHMQSVPFDKPISQPQRSRFRTTWEMNGKDDAFLLSLEAWRCEQTEKKYGRAHLRDIGPSLVMSASIRDRIVECAHHGTIKTLADVERETKWHGVKEFGKDVIMLIKEHHPTDLTFVFEYGEGVSSQPLQNTGNTESNQPTLNTENGRASQSTLSAANYQATPSAQLVLAILSDGGVAPRKRAPSKCSICGVVGHTIRSRDCRGRQDKENVPPVLRPLLLSMLPPSHPLSALQPSPSNLPLPPLLPSLLPPSLPSGQASSSAMSSSLLSTSSYSAAAMAMLSSRLASTSFQDLHRLS